MPSLMSSGDVPTPGQIPSPSSGEGERTLQGGGQEKPATGSKRPRRGSLWGPQGVSQPLCKVVWSKPVVPRAHGAAEGIDSGVGLGAYFASFGKLLNLSLTLLAYKRGVRMIAPTSQGGSENLVSKYLKHPGTQWAPNKHSIIIDSFISSFLTRFCQFGLRT